MIKYILYRILGNDIPNRHSESQTIDNLNFILEHEEEFLNCEKRFVLNRIVNQDKVKTICDLMMRAGYRFSIIPFLEGEYRGLNTNERIRYLTNVNRTRNYCIEEGMKDAEYVLPFDSGSMFRQDGWDSFDANVRFNSGDPYFIVGQWRPITYEEFLSDAEPSLMEEYKFGDRLVIGSREFTIVFGQLHDERFNEDLMYGQADKAELLVRLGVHGVWDKWVTGLLIKKKSKFSGKVKLAGWVARLPSGNVEADLDNQIRGKQRSQGLQLLLEQVNSRNNT